MHSFHESVTLTPRRPVGAWDAGVSCQPQIFAGQLTLSQSRGHIMPTTLLVAHSPGFSDPPPALRPRQAKVIPGIAAAVVAAVFMVP